MTMARMDAEPYTFEFDQRTTALVAIDMQRDFVEPGAFGEALGTEVTPLQAV
jgi:nicotinamidase-related amidase